MKKIIFTISSLVLVTLISGCSDFLDREKYGRSGTWESKADVESAVVALWSNVSNNAEGVTGRGIMWFECCSDNMTVGRPQDEANQIRNFQMSPTNGRDAKDTWPEMYKVNAKANNLISTVPTMTNVLTEDYINEVLGIAYFWRGLAMLWIAPYYGDNGPNGGIPIVLETTSTADIDSPRPESVIMNYDQIISDMRNAADRLPYLSELPADRAGFPHKAAAWAFAARAALYAASYDNGGHANPEYYYNIVLEMCNNIMALTGADARDLYDDGTDQAFANLWRSENNYCKEYLFSLVGSYVDGPKFHGMSFQNGGWGYYNTWGYYQPTLGLWEAYEEGDQRRDATILYPGQHITFVGHDILFGSADYSISSDTGMTFRKFMSPWEDANCIGVHVNTNGDNSSNDLGMSLIRFADVLLMKAEALIALNGEGDAEAKTLLNRIRRRAGLQEDSQATWAELKNERRCELAFEFMPSRFVDLVRWGDAQSVCAQPTYGISSHWDAASQSVIVDGPVQYDQGRNYDPQKNNVFAIPSAAFDGSINLKQNQGY